MNAVRYPEVICGARLWLGLLVWGFLLSQRRALLPRTKSLLEEGTNLFRASRALNCLLRNLSHFSSSGEIVGSVQANCIAVAPPRWLER
jgi:hypothetical protein